MRIAGLMALALLASVAVSLWASRRIAGRIALFSPAAAALAGGEGGLKAIGQRLAADERVAEATVKMLRAEQELGRAQQQRARVDASSPPAAPTPAAARRQQEQAARVRQQQLQRQMNSPEVDSGVRIGGVVVTNREIQGIVKQTMARLSARLPGGGAFGGGMLAAAANASNSTGGDSKGLYDQDAPPGRLFDFLKDPPHEGSEADKVPIENYLWLPDHMGTDELKNASKAPEGSLTAQAGEGSYDELGVEKPYLAIPEEQDVAIAAATPAWARKGYDKDPFFEGERIGEYDSHKPKWKKLVYGEAYKYMSDDDGYPRDRFVSVGVAKNQMHMHRGHRPLDRFPKISGKPANETANATTGGGSNGRSEEEDEDEMSDPRSDKEKDFLFGTSRKSWDEPWKRSNPFTLSDKRVKVTPNDEVGWQRFFQTGIRGGEHGGFQMKTGYTVRHEEGQEGA